MSIPTHTVGWVVTQYITTKVRPEGSMRFSQHATCGRVRPNRCETSAQYIRVRSGDVSKGVLHLTMTVSRLTRKTMLATANAHVNAHLPVTGTHNTLAGGTWYCRDSCRIFVQRGPRDPRRDLNTRNRDYENLFIAKRPCFHTYSIEKFLTSKQKTVGTTWLTLLRAAMTRLQTHALRATQRKRRP